MLLMKTISFIMNLLMFPRNEPSKPVQVTRTGPMVMTIAGPVKGYSDMSINGQRYFGFRAIPYAKPPINALRFKPPVPLNKWEGMFDGTQQGDQCPQLMGNDVIGKEDCLQLNVYTTRIGTRAYLPVMVFFHGGGFVSGSGSHAFSGPQHLMNYPMVLVTFNYRLGILGFLNTEDENAFGNYGMLDQVLVLKWIQANIAHFGGDPNKVTIFGISAGGAAVVYQLLSPLSKGLYQRAIIQSGSAISDWALKRNPLDWAKQFATQLNCSNIENTKHIVQCFSQTPFQTLIAETHKFKRSMSFPCDLVPTIEAKGGPGFLTEDPVRMIEEGRIINKVPVIMGRMMDEGYTVYSDLLVKMKNRNKMYYDEEFASDLPLLRQFSSNERAIELIKDKYLKNQNLDDPEVFEAVSVQIFSDAVFGVDSARTVEIFAKLGFEVYAYIYNHIGQYCAAQFINNKCGKYSSHADETFVQFLVANLKLTTPEDIQMSNIINSLWVSFANNNDLRLPNGKKWPLYDNISRKYAHLSLQPSIRQGILSENLTFWTETLPSL